MYSGDGVPVACPQPEVDACGDDGTEDDEQFGPDGPPEAAEVDVPDEQQGENRVPEPGDGEGHSPPRRPGEPVLGEDGDEGDDPGEEADREPDDGRELEGEQCDDRDGDEEKGRDGHSRGRERCPEVHT
jgi:hypothetical protein